MLRSKLWLMSLMFPVSSFAFSGIGLKIGDETIPIVSGNQNLTLTPFVLSLAVEDRTSQGLRIGVKIGRTGVKIEGASAFIESPSETLGLYLYLPYDFNQHVAVNAALSLTKTTPLSSETGEGADYLAKKASLGLSFRWQALRVTPTINALSLVGNYTGLILADSFRFNQVQTVYSSLNVDYFVEQNSYVRFSVTEHSSGTFNITFSTVY